MAIGERIRFFRNLRGMTQKYLGQVVGFPEKTADIRMAQYESGSRTPKAELTENLADALGVSPLALSVPDIDSYLGLMHTLFTLEDRYGLTVETGETRDVNHFACLIGFGAGTVNPYLVFESLVDLERDGYFPEGLDAPSAEGKFIKAINKGLL